MSRPLVAAIFALTATPALADLTAEEVLADHLNLLGGYGLIDMATTATAEAPDGLTVAGFVGRYEDDDSSVEILTPGMSLTEQTDGSVRIAYADSLPITINVDAKDEDPVSLTLVLNTVGLTHHVSGNPNDIQHDIAFDTLSVGDVIVDPPKAVEELNLSADIAIAGFASTIRLTNDTPARRSVDLDVAGLRMVMSMLLPADINIDTPGTTYDAVGNGETDLTFALTDLSTRIGYLDGTLPRHSMTTTLGQIQWDQSSVMTGEAGGIDMSLNGRDMAISYDVEMDFEAMEDDFLQALLDGQTMSGALNFAGLDYDFGISTPEGTFASATSSGASENRFSLSENGAVFFSDSVASVVDMGGPALGLPITSLGYSVGRALIDLAIPMTPSDDPQPFHFRMALEDVSTDDAIWNIFDPERRLSRAPASLAFDLDGTTVVEENPFTNDPDVPFRDTEARLNDFRLSIAGAEVTGDGSVIDTSTDGVPSGIGELNMTLTGVNTLIDTLVDMGLLPNEQAMGARMGLSLIARPDGDDRLISKIEVNEEGQIFANGQRLK